jgi:hypothetical protein
MNEESVPMNILYIKPSLLLEHVMYGSSKFVLPVLILTGSSNWLQAGQSDEWGSIPMQGMGIFLFSTMYRLALGPTQPPIRWILGALSLG